VRDSLQEGTSSFYAELVRLRDLVRIANGPVPLLFLLDEILHGTNSAERQIGRYEEGATLREIYATHVLERARVG
jgi:dsDNA-specific endonuclease/ATPase MutS2